MDDARPEREVKQQSGTRTSSIEVARVARRSAAHEEERHAAQDGRHTRHHVDRAKRIAERAGEIAHVFLRHRRAADLLSRAAHVHVLHADDHGQLRLGLHERLDVLDVLDDDRHRRRFSWNGNSMRMRAAIGFPSRVAARTHRAHPVLRRGQERLGAREHPRFRDVALGVTTTQSRTSRPHRRARRRIPRPRRAWCARGGSIVCAGPRGAPANEQRRDRAASRDLHLTSATR